MRSHSAPSQRAILTGVVFHPKDPNFKDRVRASFALQTAMRNRGVEIVTLEPGEVELSMPYSASFTQQNGYIHAGIITAALDSDCGYAAFSLMPSNAAVLTVEFKTTLIAPARGERFLFRANVVKPGRTLTYCEGRAFGVTNNEQRLIATMSGTLFAVVEGTT
jgi:uncharacterized protein (TIGR00369 family)